MKVLVTGSNGQLGKTIFERYNKNQLNIEFQFVSKHELDISNFDETRDYILNRKFDYCINCAAYTNVDGAEIEKELAHRINAEAVKNLALLCAELKITLIHISTDYVFNGQGIKPYKESDPTQPINEYGRSKLEGEIAIQNNLDHYFIIRTSWLYSAYGKNFVKTIVSKIRGNADLKIVSSQIGCPTSCYDLAEFIFGIIAKNSKAYGIYHYCSLDNTNWYSFATQISNYFEDYNKDQLKPIEQYPTRAERPNYSVLNTKKASKMGKVYSWKDSLEKVIYKIK